MAEPDLCDWGPAGAKVAIFTSGYSDAGHAEIVAIDRLTATQVIITEGHWEERRFRRSTGRQVGLTDGPQLRLPHDPQVQNAIAARAVSALAFDLERTTFKNIRTRQQALAALATARRQIAQTWEKLGGNANDLA